MANPLLLVAIAEFDIDVGNTLSYLYPKNFDFKSRNLAKNSIADQCLPDGAHIHQEDWTILFTEWADDKGKMTKIYGMAMFKNKPDSTVKRGAIQKSMVAFSKVPFFDVLEEILREGVARFIESEQKGKKDESILKAIFTSINENYMQKEKIKIWDKEYSLSGDIIKEDEYPKSSLKALLKRFGVDTMYLWYALLQEQRILFTGQPASEVAQCCLSCPLLVAPLRGFRDLISPYVALTDLSKVLSTTYICGTTNALFESKTEWYDLLGSFSTGIVKTGQFKISSQDREFIVNVINGMEKNGENWIRQQFRNYTRAFLESIKNDSLKNPNHKMIAKVFRYSTLYEQYKTQQKPLDEGRQAAEKAIEAFRALKSDSEITDLGKVGKLWEIVQNLVDLNTLDKVIDEDGIKVVSPLLDAQSAQVRKYSVQLLAQLAISMKGQINMLQENVICKVVAMLDDDMANVANAACYCLYKICTLYIGVYSVIKEGLHKKLFSILSKGPKSGDLLLKRTAAETLLQIYILQPNCEKVPVEEIHEIMKKEKDNNEVMMTLYRLLDVWGEKLTNIPVSEETQQHITALTHPPPAPASTENYEDPRAISTSYLLSSMTHNILGTMEFVVAGGTNVVLNNANLSDPQEALGRLSYAVLAVVADTTIGRKSLLDLQAPEKAIKRLPESTCPLYTFFILRFLEVCSQHEETAAAIIQLGGVEKFVERYLFFSKQPSLNTLCIPCLQILKNILLEYKHLLVSPNIQQNLELLKQKWLSSVYENQKTPVVEKKTVNALLTDVITLIDPGLVQTAPVVTEPSPPSGPRKPRHSIGIPDAMFMKNIFDKGNKIAEISDEGDGDPYDDSSIGIDSDTEGEQEDEPDELEPNDPETLEIEETPPENEKPQGNAL
eukprot:TRINITY_DN13205_c0_g1_i2.p1 TRINITY_DN13205_c0_g1~~TRINITY_DN13205_c0_g1_i2.p1  ORF type:complete len:893 (-),score=218.04 TRINITY_DN13205_c0_g1_i2:38-2716(-)